MSLLFLLSLLIFLLLTLALFFFHSPSPTLIYTLSPHDALPISCVLERPKRARVQRVRPPLQVPMGSPSFSSSRTSADRKSTRLNSSHTVISYAVFCLKKKTTNCTRRHRNGRTCTGRQRALLLQS